MLRLLWCVEETDTLAMVRVVDAEVEHGGGGCIGSGWAQRGEGMGGPLPIPEGAEWRAQGVDLVWRNRRRRWIRRKAGRRTG